MDREKQDEHENSMDRRQFLKACGRAAVIGGLAAVGWLAGRKSTLTAATCTPGGCRSCGELPTCSKPQALNIHRKRPKPDCRDPRGR